MHVVCVRVRAKERGADSRFPNRQWGVGGAATEPVFVTSSGVDGLSTAAEPALGGLSTQQFESMLDVDNPVSGTKM